MTIFSGFTIPRDLIMLVCVDLSAVPVNAKYGVPEIVYDKVVSVVVSSIKGP